MQESDADFQSRIARAPAKRKRLLWPRIAAIAAIVIVFFCGVIYVHNKLGEIDRKAINVMNSDGIKAGRNTAVLILAGGKTITLSDAKSGIVIGANTVTYNDGTAIEKNNTEISAGTQTIRTPKGGQYQIHLPDGTKVWLNAASALKFPSTFSGLDSRKVELSGEAYFEVSKDSKHPFIVLDKSQSVEVLGTHFNISNYSDEPDTKTTLLEGSVKVGGLAAQIHDQVVLRPGQQAINSGSAIEVVQVDTENEVAWKDGEFMFRNETLESIMKKVARWYDVEIAYDNIEISKKQFGGTISKFENVSEVLNMLELTGEVKFKIEGRTITVI